MSIRTVLIPLALAPCMAVAAMPPQLSAEYSASRRIETDQGNFEGSIAAAPGRERSEMRVGSMSTVMILRADRKLGWMLMPAQKMYQEMDLSQAAQQAGSVAPEQMDLEVVGEETVSGLTATKYKFVSKDRDAGGYLWYTAEGIPVKMDVVSRSGRKSSRMTVTLEDVQIGTQDASLFELPSGFSRLPGAGSLFGLKR